MKVLYSKIRMLISFVAIYTVIFLEIKIYSQDQTYQVVESYPHDERVYTQGLIFYEGDLLLGTGLNAGSFLRRVELPSGKTLQEISLPEKYFGEGITLINNNIIQLTWKSRIGFVYDVKTFERQGTFSYETEGWGLTHNDNKLILSDGTDRLYFLDSNSFKTIGHVNVNFGGKPVGQLNELEFVEGKVWANQWYSEYVYVIDPNTGDVSSVIDFTGLYPDLRKLISYGLLDTGAVLNGIAYDSLSKRLFITGKLWPSIYEVIVHPLSKPLPPIITDFNIGNNYVSLTVRTSRNLLYQIESSADYAFDKWDSEDKHFIGTGHKKTFKIPYNINKKQLFYRVSAKSI